MRFAGGTLMSVFRRRSEPAPAQTPEVAKPGGKGRPTPKRSEAEKRRRQPIIAPKGRKEAYRQVRGRQAEDRVKVREGMARGEERYLQKRDRGPVRRLARDYVDARRTVGSYLMWSFFVIFAVSLLPFVFAKVLVPFMFPLLLGIALVEGLVISERVKRLAAERFPGEDRSGVGMYAALRSMQIRRLRMPKPRLRAGEKAKV
ncbi:MAG: hypothetical protein JWO67_5180 [Streptosporangiaceae bacterium]|jgi:hypothetical protein|nr:hypothetical protein [Streptosporangiaceae bacterium]